MNFCVKVVCDIQHGGEILLDARVTKHPKKKWPGVEGLQTEGHGFMEGDFVISSVNAMATYQYLLTSRINPGE